MQKFHPLDSEDVPASPPHVRGTRYRVAIGVEDWPGGPEMVEKVQIVKDGKISGRQPPSFPANSSDLERVVDAMRRLKARNRTGKPLSFMDALGSAKGIYGTPEDVLRDRQSERDSWE
jgi:hypothetical protein